VGSVSYEVIDFFFPSFPNPSSHTTDPGVDSTSSRNDYQESFWRI
jgi:hypothetical protein